MHGLEIIDRYPLLDELFDEAAQVLGADLHGYRNHAYRVFNFCLAHCAVRSESSAVATDDADKIAIAAHFHDLGIWTDDTFDYLAPSSARALAYLAATGRDEWSAEITHMIMEHHKITQHRAKNGRLVEYFRRADWTDVSLGVLHYGIDRGFVAEVRSAFSNSGFHKRLLVLAGRRLRRHPLTPLPMLRW